MTVSFSECNDGDLRLSGSLSPLEGQVELCHSGLWGTVCPAGWDAIDASVVCKELGFSSYGTEAILIYIVFEHYSGPHRSTENNKPILKLCSCLPE